MKIAWFTPFHRKSAIARFSREVAGALAKTATVDLWVPDDRDLHETALRVIPFATLKQYPIWLREYDFVFYNLGDHYPNHGAIYDASKRYPGIVILHDFVMNHFFASYCWERGVFEQYRGMMQRWHGWTGSPDRVWETAGVIDYPLFQEAVDGAEAVIVHSKFLAGRIAAAQLAPVQAIPLAYDADASAPARTRAELNIAKDRVLLVTVGHVNENKRIHVVLDVLANSPELRKRVTYVAVGPCDSAYGTEVQALAKKLKLEDTVRFTGYAGDAQLRDYLLNADICINLRWPAMEGGSASCAEQMLLGKPSVVTDTGVYRELPDACVRKVNPEQEADDLRRHLTELCADRKQRIEMGKQAQQFARANFDPAVYATRVLGFCERLTDLTPVSRLVRTVTAELAAIGITPDMPIVETVAREAAELFDGSCDAPVLRQYDRAEKA